MHDWKSIQLCAEYIDRHNDVCMSHSTMKKHKTEKANTKHLHLVDNKSSWIHQSYQLANAGFSFFSCCIQFYWNSANASKFDSSILVSAAPKLHQYRLFSLRYAYIASVSVVPRDWKTMPDSFFIDGFSGDIVAVVVVDDVGRVYAFLLFLYTIEQWIRLDS